MTQPLAPIADHPFTVKRSDGIGPHPDDMACVVCNRPKYLHRINTCEGSLNIAGAAYACDLTPPHDGWAHQNAEAQAVWV